MFKSVPQVLDYIVKNIKPYGYLKYQCFYDGIQLNNKYDPIKELNELEEKCKGLRNYIAYLDVIKAAINDSSKLSLGAMKYIKHYIDHPESGFTTPYNFTSVQLGTKTYSSSYDILTQANKQAALIIEYEYMVEAINQIIFNLEKDPKFYKY